MTETKLQTTQYLRKPLYVEAVQVTKHNFLDVAEWCQGEIRSVGDDELVHREELEAAGNSFDPQLFFIRIRVHQPKNIRQTQAFVNDWLLYTNRGYKIYTPKAFRASFEKVES